MKNSSGRTPVGSLLVARTADFFGALLRLLRASPLLTPPSEPPVMSVRQAFAAHALARQRGR